MKDEKTLIEKLKTVRNFAVIKGVTTQNVYKWVKDNKVEYIYIDGVLFIISP